MQLCPVQMKKRMQRRIQMGINYEKIKDSLKERMSDSIDSYVERIKESKNGRLPSIEEIEAMWGEEKETLLKSLSEATDELVAPDKDNASKKKLP
jgi:Na+/phosphate symporter